VPSKISIPGTDPSSFALINLSGLFRSHCPSGRGFACIWTLRDQACHGTFPDVKSLLKHLLAVHVRGEEGRDIEVDWPSDFRKGDIAKCGFAVRIQGLEMRSQNGALVVPRRLNTINSASVETMSSFVSSARSETPPGTRYSVSSVSVHLGGEGEASRGIGMERRGGGNEAFRVSTVSITGTELESVEAQRIGSAFGDDAPPPYRYESPPQVPDVGRLGGARISRLSIADRSNNESDQQRHEAGSDEIFEMRD
jgi:hypothetical protein